MLDARAELNRMVDRQEEKERYWAEKRREQLGFVNNSMVGVALAGALILPALLSAGAMKKSWWSANLTIYGAAVMFLSMLVGLLVAMNRLYDFRHEADVARNPLSFGEEARMTRIEKNRETFGKVTWIGLCGQVFLAMASFLLLIAAAIVVGAT